MNLSVTDSNSSRVQNNALSSPSHTSNTNNNNENSNQSFVPFATNDRFGSYQNNILQSTITALEPEPPFLTPNPHDLPFVSPLTLSLDSVHNQTMPAISSDYEDSIEYDELLTLSPIVERSQEDNPPVVLDLTDPSSVTAPIQTGKRQTPYFTSERSTKASRLDGCRDVTDVPKKSPEFDTVDPYSSAAVSQSEEKRAKDVADAIKAQNLSEASKPSRLSDFQCIICMDSPTDLTITHCGHLFCSECLHQALYAGGKKCCPVCRTTVNLPKPGGRPEKNGAFVLEMKLMTVTKKEKQTEKNFN